MVSKTGNYSIKYLTSGKTLYCFEKQIEQTVFGEKETLKVVVFSNPNSDTVKLIMREMEEEPGAILSGARSITNRVQFHFKKIMNGL